MPIDYVALRGEPRFHLADYARPSPNGNATPVEIARPAPTQVLRVLDTHKLVTTTPPPLDWLADGVWCRGKLTLFGGREKRGKSLVQLALAVCMASGGGEVGGITVSGGRVLLIDAENGEREIHRRLRAMGLGAEHAANLTVAEAHGFELRKHLDQVAALAERHGADLVLLDSYRSLWRGDERDEAEVAAALDPLRQLAHDTEVAISLVHHAQKGGEEYRGSSAIGACIEWAVMLDREREDTDKTRRRLANPLARFAPERPDRWLQITSGGDDGPVGLASASPFVREHEAPVRGEIEAELVAYIEGCQGVGPYIGPDPLTPPGNIGDLEGCQGVDPRIARGTLTPPSWTSGDLARAIGRDRRASSFRRALQHVADLGVIHRNAAERWERSETLLDDEGAPTA